MVYWSTSLPITVTIAKVTVSNGWSNHGEVKASLTAWASPYVPPALPDAEAVVVDINEVTAQGRQVTLVSTRPALWREHHDGVHDLERPAQGKVRCQLQ
jgi:hypothetical protein